MPTLYRPPESALADEVQSALADMVIAHDVVTVSTDNDVPGDLSRSDVPVLEDDGDLFIDPDAIRERLDTLQTLMADWDRFGSDACYIDDDGMLCGEHDVDNMQGPGMTSRSVRDIS